MGDLEQTIKSICDDIDACQAVMQDMQDELDAAISKNLAAVAALREANSTIQGWAVGPADKPLDEMDHIDSILEVPNDTDHAEANAQLIAAAPELYEALSELMEAFRDYAYRGNTNGLARIKRAEIQCDKALAKVRGEVK